MTDATCFCGSGRGYAHCCEPLHSGAQRAQTAEQLMRSRYAAFCCRNAAYLIATHHPSKRTLSEREELEKNFAAIQWLGLRILGREQGQADDRQGTVEFEARFFQQGKAGSLHERSRFLKEEGQWFYLDGEFPSTAANTAPGRNDPCYCGSGKKFKKCHGA